MKSPDTFRILGVDHPVREARPKALELYQAIKGAIDAEFALDLAMSKVPDYTGSSEQIDYYGEELNGFNDAVNRLGDLLGVKD